MQRVDDHRATRCLGVQLHRRSKHMCHKRGSNATATVVPIDREPADQQRRHRVRSMASDDGRCARVIDRTHGNRRVSNNHAFGVSDDPRGGRVPTAVLPGVAAQPLIKSVIARSEPRAIVPGPIEQRGAAKLSQAR